MPANYELNIDHGVIELAAWDLVSFGDLADVFEALSTLPADLGKTVQYIDFGEATEIQVSELGAIQMSRSYEKIMDRGLRGCVLYAPSETSYEAARMLISTFASVCGDLPDGYRLTKTPLAIGEVRGFLSNTAATIPSGGLRPYPQAQEGNLGRAHGYRRGSRRPNSDLTLPS